jgi:hypothetical protein
MALAKAAPIVQPHLHAPTAGPPPRRRLWPRVLGATGFLLTGAAVCVFAMRSHLPDVSRWVPKRIAIGARLADPAPAASPIAAPIFASPKDDAPKDDTRSSSAASPTLSYEVDDRAPPGMTRDVKPSRRPQRATPYGTTAHATPAPTALPEPPTPPAAAPAKPDDAPAPAEATFPARSPAKSALESALRAAASDPADLPPAPPPPQSLPASAAKGPDPLPSTPSPSNVPERPSGSAVTGALTPPLSAGRACVAATGDPSRVTITFGSEGSVQNVTATGPAASDPRAMQCLRQAFGGAHVPPFAQSTYAASVTLRPR